MIKAYWWEGYFGYKEAVFRALRGKSPYVYNFGDRLSPFILSVLSDQAIVHSVRGGKLLSLGSIFFALRDGDHVWGSGLMKASDLRFAATCKNVTYHAVRGPDTRTLLVRNGIDCPEVYGDPALLLPLLIQDDVIKKNRIGIVPHFSNFSYVRNTAKVPGVAIIDVERPFWEVIQEILSCEVILSNSLHGLVVAEAYGIPAQFITTGEVVEEDLFKFKDYFHSTGRELNYEGLSDQTNISFLADQALKGDKAKLDLRRFLHTFPFGLKKDLRPTLAWSSLRQWNEPRPSFRSPLLAGA